MAKSPRKSKQADPSYPSFSSSKNELDNKHLVDGILKRLKLLESRKDSLRVAQESINGDDTKKDISALIDAFTKDEDSSAKKKVIPTKNPTLIPQDEFKHL